MPFTQQPRQLLTIDFSLDSKGNRETGHLAICYILSEDGQEIDARYVYDWAVQAMHNRELPRTTVAKIVEIVRKLPDPEEENIPKESLVTLTFHDGDKIKILEYHRKKLPAVFKNLLELFGGIRFELEDKIEFS